MQGAHKSGLMLTSENSFTISINYSRVQTDFQSTSRESNISIPTSNQVVTSSPTLDKMKLFMLVIITESYFNTNSNKTFADTAAVRKECRLCIFYTCANFLSPSTYCYSLGRLLRKLAGRKPCDLKSWQVC